MTFLLVMSPYANDAFVPTSLVMMGVGAALIGSSVYWLRQRRYERERLLGRTVIAVHGHGAQLQFQF